MAKLGWNWYTDTINGIRGECHATDIDMYFTIETVRPGAKKWQCYFKHQGAYEELTIKKLARSKKQAIRICEEFHESWVETIARSNGYVRLAEGERVISDVAVRCIAIIARHILREEKAKRKASSGTHSNLELMSQTLLDCFNKPGRK